MTATLAPSKGSRKAAKDLAAATVVLELRLFAPSFRRKIETKDVVAEEEVGPGGLPLLHVRKDLIDPKALREIGQARSRFKRWLGNRTIACGMLRGGTWLLPLNLVEETVHGTDQFILEDKAQVKKLTGRLVELKAEAEQRLGPQFVASEYPSAEEIEAAYGISYRFVGFNVPAALEDLNRELYDREMAKVEMQCVAAGDEIRQGLREAFAGLIEHMADRLGSDPASGKPKVFRDTTVTQMQDFLTTFAARNLTGDDALAQLAQEAKNLLTGVEAGKLRDQEGVRERVKEGMEAIKAKMDEAGMVTKVRQFATDEEV